MNAYHYTCPYRPPQFNLPEGWELVERGTAGEFPLRTDLPQGTTRFGVIRYRRPLSKDEIRHNQLMQVE